MENAGRPRPGVGQPQRGGQEQHQEQQYGIEHDHVSHCVVEDIHA